MKNVNKAVLAIAVLLCISTIQHIHCNRLETKISGLEMIIKQLESIETQEYIPMVVTATGYAPLDPNAIEGVCYSGDPAITASGAKSDPNRTIAAAKEIPFGTQVYIPGIGYRVVEDRGGAIKGNKIDIMFPTQQMALEWGVKEITIFIKKG